MRRCDQTVSTRVFSPRVFLRPYPQSPKLPQPKSRAEHTDFTILVTQERITDSDTAKVDANVKSDAPDASNASKINTPNIDVKTGIVKPCAVAIKLSQHVSLR